MPALMQPVPMGLHQPAVHMGMQMVPMMPVIMPIADAGGMPMIGPQHGFEGLLPMRSAGWPQTPQGGGQVPVVLPSPVAIPQPGVAIEQAAPASTPGNEVAPGDHPFEQSVAAAATEAPAAPQPHTLTRNMSTNSGRFRVHWTVDARKLRGNDKQAVSPPFELSFGSQYPNVIFKMIIYPMFVNDAKGGASFKKARGHGFVQLKCEAELSEAHAQVSYRIYIGSGDKLQAPRGPVLHNFAHSAVSRLPKKEEEWDFNAAVDQESMTFCVCLEVTPMFDGQS
eukprot:TRINITY_DN3568_c0_g1_i2.p1 TRINITY_DN3568_c0_g1~~TRINITY_DN3568_c0_g1_i2.p1  ORF type:complete len:312 (-),score=52.33 TRINITY_DN3568_c0_g1_i2:44-886(-)